MADGALSFDEFSGGGATASKPDVGSKPMSFDDFAGTGSKPMSFDDFAGTGSKPMSFDDFAGTVTEPVVTTPPEPTQPQPTAEAPVADRREPVLTSNTARRLIQPGTNDVAPTDEGQTELQSLGPMVSRGLASGAELGAKGIAATGRRGAYSLLDAQNAAIQHIDAGESVPETDDPAGYQHMDPASRAKLKAELAEKEKVIAENPVQSLPAYRAGEDVKAWYEKNFPVTKEHQQEFWPQVAQALGTSGSMLAPAVVPGVGGAILLGGSALQGAGQGADDAIEKNATDRQIAASGSQNLGAGAVDWLEIENLLRKTTRNPGLAGLLTSVAKKAVEQGVVEGTTEGLQQVWQNVIAKTGYDPDRSVLDQVWENFSVGGVLGFLTGGLAGAATPKHAGDINAPRNTNADVIPPGAPASQSPNGGLQPPGPTIDGTATEITPEPEPTVEPAPANVVHPALVAEEMNKLMPEDRASPIPDELIAQGRAALRAAAGEGPAAPAPTPAAPTVGGFRTALGSTYDVTADGQTIRTKNSPGRGQGTMYEPHNVLYVEPEVSQALVGTALADYRISIGYSDGTNFVPFGSAPGQVPAGGTPMVLVQSRQGGKVIDTYPASTVPSLGLHPIEKRYDAAAGTSSTHLGNQIVEMIGPDGVTTAVQPTPEAPPAAPPGAPALNVSGLQRVDDGSLENPVTVRSPADLEHAIKRVDTNATQAQTEAENHRMAHIRIEAAENKVLDISLHRPKGSIRSGTGPDGQKWENVVPEHYGYMKRTVGGDRENFDVSVGHGHKTFIVDQHTPETGKFDEHKGYVNMPSRAAAVAAYDANFSDGSGPSRRRGVTELTKEQLYDFAHEGDTSRPYAPQVEQNPERAHADMAVTLADPQNRLNGDQRRLAVNLISHGMGSDEAVARVLAQAGTGDVLRFAAEHGLNLSHDEARTAAVMIEQGHSPEDAITTVAEAQMYGYEEELAQNARNTDAPDDWQTAYTGAEREPGEAPATPSAPAAEPEPTAAQGSAPAGEQRGAGELAPKVEPSLDTGAQFDVKGLTKLEGEAAPAEPPKQAALKKKIKAKRAKPLDRQAALAAANSELPAGYRLEINADDELHLLSPGDKASLPITPDMAKITDANFIDSIADGMKWARDDASKAAPAATKTKEATHEPNAAENKAVDRGNPVSEPARVYQDKAGIEAAISDGSLRSAPERAKLCYKFAGDEAIAGAGDFVIATVGSPVGRIFHAVVENEAGNIYDPQYNAWFTREAYSEAVDGMIVLRRMTGQEVQAFGIQNGKYPSPTTLNFDVKAADVLPEHDIDHTHGERVQAEADRVEELAEKYDFETTYPPPISARLKALDKEGRSHPYSESGSRKEQTKAVTDESLNEIQAIYDDISHLEESKRLGIDPTTGEAPRGKAGQDRVKKLDGEIRNLDRRITDAVIAYAEIFGDDAGALLDREAKRRSVEGGPARAGGALARDEGDVLQADPTDPSDKLAAAWHGSPHEFDQVDLSRVGTGEGKPAAAKPFFSALTSAVEDSKQTKAPAPQWKAFIKNLRSKGVKEEEIDWSGVEQWLDEQKAPVTKEQVVDFLRQNEVKVEEVVKGSALEQDKEEGSWSPAAKFSTYALPGGENYRELLLTLPEKRNPDLSLNNDDADAQVGTFRGGHFDEPNVVAHIRFNERTDADGKKVLFIEEIQSDWHQKGRKQGYAGAARSVADIDRDMDADLEELERREPNAEPSEALWERHPDVRANHRRLRNERNAAQNGVPDAPFKTTWQELAFKRALRWAAENGFDKIAWTTGAQQADRYDLSKQVSEIVYTDNGRLIVYTKPHRDAAINQAVPEDKLPDYIGKEGAEKLLAQKPGNISANGQARTLLGPDLKVGGEGMKGFYDNILPNFANKYAKKWGAKVGTTEIGADTLKVEPRSQGGYAILNPEDGSLNGHYATKEEAEKVLDAGRVGHGEQVHSLDITPEMRESVLGGQSLFAAGSRNRAEQLIVDDAKGTTKNRSFRDFAAKHGLQERYGALYPALADHFEEQAKTQAQFRDALVGALRDLDRDLRTVAEAGKITKPDGTVDPARVIDILEQGKYDLRDLANRIRDARRRAPRAAAADIAVQEPAARRDEAAGENQARRRGLSPEEIHSALRAELDRLGLRDIKLDVRDFIPDRQGNATSHKGRYRGLQKLIQIAMKGDLRWTLDHEIIHALRDLGVIRDLEWRVLVKAATADKAKLAALRANPAYADLSEDRINEEAVADLHADTRNAKDNAQPKGFVRAAWERIRKFFEALRNVFRGLGFTTAEDIFSSIDKGEVGGRDRALDGAPRTGEAYAAEHSIVSFVKRWFEDPRGKVERLNVAPVSDEEAAMVKEATGLDIAGRTHVLASDYINHIRAAHGPLSNDRSPVTPEDFARLPDILSNPDRVWKSDHDHRGMPIIVYEKRIGDRYVAAEFVRPSKPELVLLSFLKRPAGSDAAGASPDLHARDERGADQNIAPGNTLDKGTADAQNPAKPLHSKIVRNRLGDQTLRDAGYDPANLTADQAKDLLGFRDADQFRAARAKAESGRIDRLQSKGVRAPEASQERLNGPDRAPDQSDKLAADDGVAPEAEPYLDRAAASLDGRGATPLGPSIAGVPLPFQKDLGAYMKHLGYPRQIAAYYRHFTPVWNAGVSQFAKRDRIAARLIEIKRPYDNLSRDSMHKVNQVLELGRLQGSNFEPDRDGKIRVMNQAGHVGTHPLGASLSRMGDEITLEPWEVHGYQAVRKTMNKALDLFRDQVVKEFGFNPHDPDAPTTAIRASEMAEDAEKAGDSRESERLGRLANVLGDIEQARRSGYVPFSRYGQWSVSVRGPTGDTVYREHFEHPTAAKQTPLISKIARKRAQKAIGARVAELERLFPQTAGNIVRRVEQITPKMIEDIPSMADLDSLLTESGLDVATTQAVQDAVAGVIQRKSFRKHFIQSRNIPGYTADFERSLADYVTGLAGYLARRDTKAEFDEAIAGIPAKQPKLMKYAKAWHDYIESPSEEYSTVRQVGFFMYLAGRLSSALINTTQVPLFTMPYLAHLSNPAVANLELARAYKDVGLMLSVDAAKKLTLFDPNKAPLDVRAKVVAAIRNGTLLPLETLQEMAKANSRTPKGRDVRRKVNKVLDLAAIAFTGTERLNRIVSFIAAVRVAERPSVIARANRVLRDNEVWGQNEHNQTPEGFGKWVVDETHFVMGKLNRPTMMRGVGAWILQFKSYMLNSLEMMWRMGLMHRGWEGKAALAAIGVMLILSGGLWGLPGAEDLRDLIEWLYQFFKEKDIDLDKELHEMFGGSTLGRVVAHGALRESGVDVSHRIGMGSIIPRPGLGDGTFEKLAPLLGMPGSYAVRAAQFAGSVARGDALSAAGAALPEALADIVRAEQMRERGTVARGSGRKMIDKDQVLPDGTKLDDTTNLMKRALGFQPTGVARAQEAYSAVERQIRGVDELRRRIYTQFASAFVQAENATSDAERRRLDDDMDRMQDEVDKHNDNAPDSQQIEMYRTTQGGKRSFSSGLQSAIDREREGAIGTQDKHVKKKARGEADDIRSLY